MKQTFPLIIASTLTLLSVTSQAQEASKIGLGLKIGTTGLGLELSVPLSDTINLRGGYNYAEYDVDFEDTDIDYNAEFDQSSIALMLDWHPGNHGFRVSLGALSHSNNDLNLEARTMNGSYEINGNSYDASQIGSLVGEASFKKTTPYVGIGWGNATAADNGFGFTVDLGVLIQDNSGISMSINNCMLSTAICTQLDNDVQAESLELNDELGDFEYWPVANIGFSFNF